MSLKICKYNILSNLSLVFLLSSLLINPAMSDGTHGVKVKVTNNTNREIQVLTFNAKDKSDIIPHKVYYISKDGTRWVKAHGQGKNRIRIRIQPKGQVDSTVGCYDDSGNMYNEQKDVSDGKSLVISDCDEV